MRYPAALLSMALAAPPLVVCRVGHSPRETRGVDTADFSFVGVHPGAVEQPTERGRILATLAAWDGRVYAGYGDINANTGPIAVAPFDPRTGTFEQEWVSDTEAVYTYRPIGGLLYAPAIDRRADADFAVGKPWRDVRSPMTDHAYDMATLTGADLWLVGSEGLDAVAWRSRDGGRTWAESLRVRPFDVTGKDFSRFFFVFADRGRLYVHASDSHHGPKPASKVFDGEAWSDGPNLLPLNYARGWHPVSFAGLTVYQSAQTVKLTESRLLSFDGEKVELPLAAPIRDFVVDRGRLFALTTRGTIERTRDLLSWSTVASAPPGGRSIGALDGFVYIGTADSKLYRSRRRLE